STWQNAETKLISNGLRFILTCPLFLAQPITFHGLRHTYATLQLAAGTDLYTISKMLTHSNVGTTQVYADVVSDLKRKASEQITLKQQ
ncbi:tyrosine-type recombinase/integrase, partial [Bacteroides acidifaciens]|uniref:tyrosine-type recombinase/integrase n=1 Tax=Bacteroides acidifaciens TaxID=85831 RepID=UPI0025A95656